MKRHIVLALVFGWFFMVQSAGEPEGVFVTTVVGPYSTEGACKAEYANVVASLGSLGVVFTNQKGCWQAQEV